MFAKYQRRSLEELRKSERTLRQFILRKLENQQWYNGSKEHFKDLRKLTDLQKEIECRDSNLFLGF